MKIDFFFEFSADKKEQPDILASVIKDAVQAKLGIRLETSMCMIRTQGDPKAPETGPSKGG